MNKPFYIPFCEDTLQHTCLPARLCLVVWHKNKIQCVLAQTVSSFNEVSVATKFPVAMCDGNHSHQERYMSAGGTHFIKSRYLTAAERRTIREKHSVPPIWKPIILKQKTNLPQTAKVSNVAGLKSAGSDFDDDVGDLPTRSNARLDRLEMQNASLKRMLGEMALAAAQPKGMAKPSSKSLMADRPKGMAKPSSNLVADRPKAMAKPSSKSLVADRPKRMAQPSSKR